MVDNTGTSQNILDFFSYGIKSTTGNFLVESSLGQRTLIQFVNVTGNAGQNTVTVTYPQSFRYCYGVWITISPIGLGNSIRYYNYALQTSIFGATAVLSPTGITFNVIDQQTGQTPTTGYNCVILALGYY